MRRCSCIIHRHLTNLATNLLHEGVHVGVLVAANSDGLAVVIHLFTMLNISFQLSAPIVIIVIDLPSLLSLRPHPVDQSVEEHLDPGNNLLNQIEKNTNQIVFLTLMVTCAKISQMSTILI